MFPDYGIVCLEWSADGPETVARVKERFGRLKQKPPLVVLLLPVAREEALDSSALALVAPGTVVFRKPLSLELVQTIMLNHHWLAARTAAGGGGAPSPPQGLPLGATGVGFFGSAGPVVASAGGPAPAGLGDFAREVQG